ncbi:MAG TPA: carbohydrate kinase family protein [Candidatus Dormibacteraeota bacterium]|nr:carbohydrate kinase family protein [Candidatus Dormibacteraeota bacterium]
MASETDGKQAVRLKEMLENAKPSFKVVVMPDFFLDYILSHPGKLEDMTASFEEVAKRGGGNLLGWRHTIGRGGNASNMVAQLSTLGCKVVPIIETDELGLTVLQHFLKGVDLSHVRPTGTMSRTLCFETEHSGRRVNIMVSDPGSLSSFGPEKLTEEDKRIIAEADFVCVLNWNQNQKGTELAEKVFSIAKEEGKATTFFDPGDPALRIGEIEGLNQKILTPGLVDVLSVNENELVHLARGVAEDTSQVEGAEENSLFEAASVFSMMVPRVDLHTPEFSATFVDGQRLRVPCAKIKPSKVTGAGDVWNAADIFAQGIGLEHRERLIFANAAGAAYLERSSLEPLRLADVVGRIDDVVAARKS